ncbi:MAG: metallophosphoesterase [Ignisphaera sp.]|nr:metallophosphoesterase [Ignisphaera sp.]
MLQTSLISVVIASTLYTLLLITYTLYNFPWISSIKSLTVHQVMLGKSDLLILIVSDLHLGNNESRYRHLLTLLKVIKPSTLIIAGDLLDKRVLVGKEMLKLLKKFTRYSKNVFYTPSSSNHDNSPQPMLLSLEESGKRIIIAAPILKLCVEECLNCIYITHGDCASRSGVIAHFLEIIAQKLFSKPFIGGVLRRKLGIGAGDWIVYGHSHRVWVSKAWRVVNTGCWVSRVHESMQMAIAIATCKKGIATIKLIKI